MLLSFPLVATKFLSVNSIAPDETVFWGLLWVFLNFVFCVSFVVVFFSLTSLSRLFYSYRDESIGSWGETGVPWENHLTHPQAELGLSHMCPVRGSNLHQT